MQAVHPGGELQPCFLKQTAPFQPLFFSPWSRWSHVGKRQPCRPVQEKMPSLFPVLVLTSFLVGRTSASKVSKTVKLNNGTFLDCMDCFSFKEPKPKRKPRQIYSAYTVPNSQPTKPKFSRRGFSVRVLWSSNV